MALQMKAAPQSNLFSELTNIFGKYYLQQGLNKPQAVNPQQPQQAAVQNPNGQQAFNALDWLNNAQAGIRG
jgi:hypothetical protein